jgi:type IV secretory pathway VirD2 relaxase
MAKRSDDRFRPRPRAPRARGGSDQSPFVSRVIEAMAKAGPSPGGRSRNPLLRPSHVRRPGTRLGRGHVAAKFAGQQLGPRSRRAIIKTRLVVLHKASPQSIATHLRYIQRDGVTPEGGRGELYGAETDHADGRAFERRSQNDRHQFRFIVSPEDAVELSDLKSYTRDLMRQVEGDLGTRLDWVATDHWDTDNPHTHIVLRGRDATGHDLIIAGDYIAHGMRHRAAEIATEWLGPRTEMEIRRSLAREVEQERWTSLDRSLHRQMSDGIVDLRHQPTAGEALRDRVLLIGRLDKLRRMGLAHETTPARWVVSPHVEETLRTLGERGDIIRTMQRAFTRERREYSIFDAASAEPSITGRVAAKGLSNELHDRGYVIIDGVDGRAHYVVLASKMDLSSLPTGAIVTVRSVAEPRSADRTIAALAQDGHYHTTRHLEVARAEAKRGRDPDDFVQAYVRRLEALRRAGVVERVADGVWRIPPDFVERAQAYDVGRMRGATVAVRSYLPIEQQGRAIGATWLDRQLLDRADSLSMTGFGANVRESLQQRERFLVEQGLAENRGDRVILARNLLATLRTRELSATASKIATETGLAYRPVADRSPVSGIYRRAVTLASGRFAMLEDGLGFSLVPWRPVIEQRLGASLRAVVRGDGVSWDLGRQRGISR